MAKMLVTGGAGFIGCNFVKLAVSRGYDVTVIDKLTYAGSKENLSGVIKKLQFIKGDITSKKDVEKSVKGNDIIINFAAETHVDRSIKDATGFASTNVIGTCVLLDAAKNAGIEKFVQISTDEVYGSIESGKFVEEDPIKPRNPYSATKAAAEQLAFSYFVTHNLPVVITRSSNNYGPYQNPEKFIPKAITNAIKNRTVPVYGKGQNVRDWIFVEDNCEAILAATEKGKAGETYNIGGGNEKKNIEAVKLVLKILGKPETLIEFVQDRSGHDFRYALDSGKIRKLGWRPENSFEDGIKKTVKWYKDNNWFWDQRNPNLSSRM